MIEIPLTKGQAALIDDDDWELVSAYKWFAHWAPNVKSFYAKTNIHKPDGGQTGLLMHRLIMNAQKGEIVDHIRRDTLDNRKTELRFCTYGQNRQNARANSNTASGLKGVTRNGKRWTALIQSGGRKIYLGTYTTPEEAHTAYCTASNEFHGDFGRIA